MNTKRQKQTVQAPVYIGIDIAKETFDADLPGGIRQFKNTGEAIKEFLAQIPNNSQLVMEATGPYHLQLLERAHQAGVKLCVLNPTWVSNFRTSTGRRAKTDAIDAAVITAYARVFQPKPSKALPASLKALKEMHAVRESLISMRVALESQMAHLSDAVLRTMLRSQIRTLLNREEKITSRMAETIREDLELRARAEVMVAHKGIGPQCVATLLCDLPELGTMKAKSIAALAGVAPFNNDSGKYRGKRHVAGGRRKVRKALYMAALSASRHHPVFARLKAKMKAQGKPGKVILIAIARRLVVILNAQIRDHLQPPNPVAPAI